MLGKPFYVAAGFLALALGVVGIFLPLLPTTPLVLLSAFCFSKSNKRLEAWLLRSRLFGPFIENYRTKKGISRRHKTGTLIFLWVGLVTSMVVIQAVWAYILLGVVGLGVSLHVLKM